MNFPVNGQFPNAAASQYLQVRGILFLIKIFSKLKTEKKVAQHLPVVGGGSALCDFYNYYHHDPGLQVTDKHGRLL